jgi:localization factor PodJL
MTSGVPWQAKGVRREVIDSAREAARRAGMTVEEWLDTVIVESARNAGVDPDPHPSAFSDRPPPAESHDPPTPYRGASAESAHPQAAPFSDVKARLDALSRQLDDIARIGEARQQARQQSHLEDTPRLIADAVAHIDHRIERLVADKHSANTEIERRANVIDRAVARMDPDAPDITWSDGPESIDQAMAEIAARQRILDRDARGPAPDLPRAPTQRLPDLEQLLREINAQVETARPCGIDNAIETIRNDLAEIGLMVKEAMPRHAIEALESEVRSLASRIDSERRDGSDRNAIAGLERGLAEVRDALHTLTPAESLSGFDQMVQNLSQKIDRVAKTGQDHPQVLKQLESAIVALRSTVANVASNDALAQLSADVRTLSAKFDQVSVSDAFMAMERRIAAMADTLEESRNAPAPDSAVFEAAVQGLADKIDQLRSTYADQPAIYDLEQRIARLIDKFEASGARLDHLETIERALADLLIHIESLRMSAGRGNLERADTDALKHDVRRAHDSLETMHGTLGRVVDRLARIEAGINKNSRGLEMLASPPIAPPQRIIDELPVPARLVPSAIAERRPIDPDLPPDHPLEPGGGPSRGGGNSPADRIAASEAALANVRSPAGSDPTSRSDFIAAARRAAQAAMEAPKPERRSPNPEVNDDVGASSSGGLIGKLAIAASISLLALGAMHYGLNRFGWYGTTNTSEPTVHAAPEVAVPGPALATTPDVPDQRSVALPPNIVPSQRITPSTDISAPPQPTIPVPNLDTTGTIIRQPESETGSLPPPPQTAAPQAPSAQLLSPQALSSQPIASQASLPEAGPTLPLPQASPLRNHGADRSGTSTSLRAAAANGDPAAAFEIASRFADGRGVQQNLSEAAVWFERAASKGLIPAQFRLGGLYEKGLGVRKNLETARRLYTAAAEAGHAKAMHNLAVLYAEGIEGKPDYATAARWFRRASDYGVVDSQYNLAILYARGIGVETDLAEAFKWFALASREGDRDASKKRDEIASRLDKQSLAAAMAAAKAWQAQPQPKAAIEVPAPPGGWDGAPTASAAKRGSKASAQSRRPTQ